jgi:hypothetical protein
MEQPPNKRSVKCSVMPEEAAAASSTRTACPTTSGPMPSPGTNTMFFSMISFPFQAALRAAGISSTVVNKPNSIESARACQLA